MFKRIKAVDNLFSMGLVVGIIVSFSRLYTDCWKTHESKMNKRFDNDEDDSWGQFVVIDNLD